MLIDAQSRLKQLFKDIETLRKEQNEKHRQWKDGKLSDADYFEYDVWFIEENLSLHEARGDAIDELLHVDIGKLQEVDDTDSKYTSSIVYPTEDLTQIEKFHYLLLLQQRIVDFYVSKTDSNNTSDALIENVELYHKASSEIRTKKEILRQP